MFADNSGRNEVAKSGLTSTDSFYQVLQFYLMNSGKDFMLADTITSYGCWCQLRNAAAKGLVPGKKDIC